MNLADKEDKNSYCLYK